MTTPDPFSTWLNSVADQLRKPKEEPEVQDKEDEEEDEHD
jgi:hypothetical protein